MKFLKYFGIFLLVLILSVIFLLYDNIKAPVQSNKLSANLVNSSSTEVKISNTEINGVLYNYITNLKNDVVNISGFKTEFTKDNLMEVKLYGKANSMKFPTSASIYLSINGTENLKITLEKIKIGKITVPRNLVKNIVRNNSLPKNDIIQNFDAEKLSMDLDLNKIINEKQKIATVSGVKIENGFLVLNLKLNEQVKSIIDNDLKNSALQIENNLSKINSNEADKEVIKNISTIISDIRLKPVESVNLTQVMSTAYQINTLDGDTKSQVINTLKENLSDKKKRELIKLIYPNLSYDEITKIIK